VAIQKAPTPVRALLVRSTALREKEITLILRSCSMTHFVCRTRASTLRDITIVLAVRCRERKRFLATVPVHKSLSMVCCVGQPLYLHAKLDQ